MTPELTKLLEALVETCMDLGIPRSDLGFLATEDGSEPVGAQVAFNGVVLWVTSDPVTPLNQIGVSAEGNWGAVSWSHKITTACLNNIDKDMLVLFLKEGLGTVSRALEQTQVN